MIPPIAAEVKPILRIRLVLQFYFCFAFSPISTTASATKAHPSPGTSPDACGSR
jgi:hypothetical protein